MSHPLDNQPEQDVDKPPLSDARLAAFPQERRDYVRSRAGGNAYSDELIDWLVEHKFISSLTWEELQERKEFYFPKAKETETGGLLICHNPRAKDPHFQLRCDVAPFDEERSRSAKYLMQGQAGERLAVWDPSGLVGPSGETIGQARIGTEGFLDAVYCTFVLGIPCMAITAPSHLRVLDLPEHLRLYLGDCDQWMARDLLPTVVRGCVTKGLKLARLPLVDAHRDDYLKPHSQLPNSAKGGMEELGQAHGVEAAKAIVEAVVTTACEPGDYLSGEIKELSALGLRWPEHSVSLTNLISAMADAHPTNKLKREALKAEIVLAVQGLTAAPVNSGIKDRLARREAADRLERQEAREEANNQALARGEAIEPEIDKEDPTNRQLQEWISYAHTVRFNDLSSTPEMDGNPISDLDLTWQLLAQQHGIEANKTQAADVLIFVAKSNPYNPVAEYLERVRGDASIVPLAEEEVYRLFGLAPTDTLSRTLLKRSLAGTALRGLEPGCKFDCCPILRGRQGNGKTETLRALASDSWADGIGDYGSGSQLALSGWAVMAKANGSWIFELGEVERLTQGRCQSAFKDWLSERLAKYQEKFEKVVRDHPRRFVTWGTTNERELLNDETGTRRFWIIECPGVLQWQVIRQERDRIWKAALQWLDQGLEVWLNPETEDGAAALAASAERGMAATFTDPWLAVLLEYLAATSLYDRKMTQAERLELARSGGWKTVLPEGDGVPLLKLRYIPIGHKSSENLALIVSLADLYDALGVKAAQQNKGLSARLNKVMHHHEILALGWAHRKTKKLVGYALDLGSDDLGSDSGSDSPLGSDSRKVTKTRDGDSDLGLVPILFEEGRQCTENKFNSHDTDKNNIFIPPASTSTKRIETKRNPSPAKESWFQFEKRDQEKEAENRNQEPDSESQQWVETAETADTPLNPTAELIKPDSTEPLVVDLETYNAETLWSQDGFIRLVGTDHGNNTDPSSLADHAGALVAHNGFGFDFLALAHHTGLDFLALSEAGRLIDTMALETLSHPNRDDSKPEQYLKQLSLNSAASRRGIEGKTDDLSTLAQKAAKAAGIEGTPTELKNSGFGLIPQNDPAYNSYLRGDIAATRSIFDSQCPSGVLDEYQSREMRLMGRLSYGITFVGFRIDRAEIERREAEKQSKVAAGTAQLQSIGLPARVQKKDGSWTAPHSSAAGKEAIDAAFKALGVDLPRTATGKPQIKAETLKDIAADHKDNTAVVDLCETVSGLVGARSSMANILKHATGDRVHPSVFPGQATGRFSITNPGLTVLGKRGSNAAERETFLPDTDEHVLLAIDLSKADARAVAVHSQDNGYLDIFDDPSRDINKELAAHYGITKTMAKALGHGTRYNQQSGGMHRQTGIDKDECQRFIQAHKRDHRATHQWINRVVAIGESGRPLDNGFGRKLFTGHHTNGERKGESKAFTQAPAYIGQSTTREWMAEGVLRLPLDIAKQIRCFLHDEVVLSVPIAELERYKAALLDAFQFEWAPPKESMVIPISGEPRKVKVVAELSAVGKNWADCYRDE